MPLCVHDPPAVSRKNGDGSRSGGRNGAPHVLPLDITPPQSIPPPKRDAFLSNTNRALVQRETHDRKSNHYCCQKTLERRMGSFCNLDRAVQKHYGRNSKEKSERNNRG